MVEIFMSKAEYRRGRNLEEALLGLPEVRIRKMPSFGLRVDQGLWAKALLASLYFIFASVHALSSRKVSINVFLAQPPLIPLLGYALSILRGQPYICVVNDINTQTPVELGAASQDSKTTRLLRQLTVFSWMRATAIVVIGRCMADRLAEMGIPSERVRFIHQWANEVEIYPIDRASNPVRRDFDFLDRFVVLYAGNIGVPQFFDDLLDVAETLQAREDILFVIVGEGSRKRQVENKLRDLALSNLILLPLLHDRYPLADILSAGDLHFVSLKEAWTGLGVPSKSYSAMAAGRPLVYQGGRSGEIARMVLEEEIGAWVGQGDVQGLRTAIVRYADHPDLGSRHGQRARELIETKLSRRDALEQYSRLLATPCDSPSHS